MRRRPTDHAAGSAFFRYRLRSGCWPRMRSSFSRFVRRALWLSSGNKLRKPMFRTPENKKTWKLFALLILFGKIGTVLNERKRKSKEKKPTMAVWHDRYDGVFHHGWLLWRARTTARLRHTAGRCSVARQPMQRIFRRSVATSGNNWHFPY